MQRKKAEIMDEGAMRRALTRIAYQIIERNHGAKDVLLAGVRTRGLPLADRIADKIGEVEGFRPPVIALDISSLRDDVPRDSRAPISFPDLPGLENSTVILVDDVLYTGRTVRAAMDAISQMGRAGRIQLAVMIDRGHRELPIRPDYVGKNLPTAQSERVQVCLHEIDDVDAVRILEEKP
ncbi:bifunctional pyr operon transcriptional regulator/uracil phosphoribosyltransferase PyrR [Intestinibacillus sp. Marseille-P6563]|uniref:bifunctional pyr operon transcriptional regulator/uracil phosphoribosyltransferase PyrR n=1 Tax=Intestinibacillus sp. Marseille-P6563 TaxID=2364792 RepID=UPI00242C79BC|nr:bifunctional pyr operon transcriptional regulator/uracil phosphoribosyltransferase PyrR [Intestinibacillus sp. Marseille-P6563]